MLKHDFTVSSHVNHSISGTPLYSSREDQYYRIPSWLPYTSRRRRCPCIDRADSAPARGRGSCKGYGILSSTVPWIDNWRKIPYSVCSLSRLSFTLSSVPPAGSSFSVGTWDEFDVYQTQFHVEKATSDVSQCVVCLLPTLVVMKMSSRFRPSSPIAVCNRTIVISFEDR